MQWITKQEIAWESVEAALEVYKRVLQVKLEEAYQEAEEAFYHQLHQAERDRLCLARYGDLDQCDNG
ncbi:hypothetical protein [Thermus thermamylovorans]|uniref:Uncharacterized protein n=1 Tax=Thermus thermamylovorans TaxID=2509362 RepID=A0A4Q9AVW3_9DEIN|nr:hypothetical protein [Thermus thermamylovorans]TBH14953.1 hypothetical protein ETP66_11385 [Thermus thermamylovorans]